MSEIRHRTTTGQTMVVTTTAPPTSNNDDEDDDMVLGITPNLSAKSLIDASPQHHGVVLKLHIPLIYKILPEFIQRIILSWNFLSSWLGLGPSWKQRYLILCGSYLYKFNSINSKKTKGSPFAIETTDVNIISGLSDIPENFILPSLPIGYKKIFCVSTLRRQHYYAVLDNTEASIWIQSVHEAKQATITRNMGHSSHMPYPKLWKHYDCLGKDIINRNERIKSRIENNKMISEMEMTNMSIGGGSGGTLPRGYYG